MSDISFGLTMTALAVGGVLVVAAKFHRYTYRAYVKDSRQERRLYWWSWLIGGGLLVAAMIPNGWQPVLAAVAVGKRVVPIAMRRVFVAVGGSGRSGRVRH